MVGQDRPVQTGQGKIESPICQSLLIATISYPAPSHTDLCPYLVPCDMTGQFSAPLLNFNLFAIVQPSSR